MKHPRLLRLGLALASPILLLALLEGGARWWDGGDGRPPMAGYRDPYFRPLVAALEPGADGSHLRDADGRPFLACDPSLALKIGQEPCDRRWFVAEKRPGSVRIFCLGGSSTYGLNYAPTVSFAGLLEARLRRLRPDLDLEVINAGISGYHARDVREVAHEAMDHEADVLVIYAGHNELKYPNLAQVQHPGWSALLGRSHLLRSLVPVGVVPVMPETIVEQPFLEAAVRQQAEQGYRQTLQDLLEEARAHGVKVVLATPASNVRDKVPRLTVLTGAPTGFLTASASLRRREKALGPSWIPEADAEPMVFGQDETDPGLPATLAELDALLERFPDASLAHFLRGRILWRQGRAAEAQQAFRRSQETDGLPERATPTMVQAVRDLAREYQVPLADVVSRLADLAPGGTPGFDLFFDYCHPNLEGHWWIADTVLRALVEHEVLGPSGAFVWDAEPHEDPLQAYLETLEYDPAQQVLGRLDRVRTLIGQILESPEGRDRRLASAEEMLVGVLRDHPKEPDAILLLGLVAAMQGRRAEAQDFLSQGMERGPDQARQLATRIGAVPALLKELARVRVTVRDGRFVLPDESP